MLRLATHTRTITLTAIILGIVGFAAAQTSETKDSGPTKAPNAAASNPQTVNAQQSGAWTVGLDSGKNTVRIGNTEAEPVPVKVMPTSNGRKAFQARLIVAPQGEGFASAPMQIPAGKRLVIENISAVGRTPPGLRMEINFFTYIDNNGDGVGDISDIVFHRIALIDQGTFLGTSIASANHKVLVFADEQIGTGHFGVTLQARLSGSTTEFAQAQVTFSGYVEDIPAIQ